MKLLVTGASGFLGWHVTQLAARSWQVYGTMRSTSPRGMPEIPGVTAIPLDLTDSAALQETFQQVRPDAVIHLAAESSPNRCQTDPEGSHAVNVTAAANVAGFCAEAAIPCVFTSTELVFDGRNAPYRETDPVCPLSRYGEQKVLAEQAMLARYPQTAVCRMPLMFGDVPPHASSFLQPWLETLRQGREVRLFVDEWRTPVSGRTAAQGLLLAIDRQVTGILHLGGAERISRYELGQLLVEILDVPASGLVACRQQDVPMAAPRPADVSLDSSQAFALGYQPPAIRAELLALRGRV